MKSTISYAMSVSVGFGCTVIVYVTVSPGSAVAGLTVLVTSSPKRIRFNGTVPTLPGLSGPRGGVGGGVGAGGQEVWWCGQSEHQIGSKR